MLAGWKRFRLGVGDVVGQASRWRRRGSGRGLFAARESCGVTAGEHA